MPTYRFIQRFERFVDIEADTLDDAERIIEDDDPFNMNDLPDWVDTELVSTTPDDRANARPPGLGPLSDGDARDLAELMQAIPFNDPLLDLLEDQPREEP